MKLDLEENALSAMKEMKFSKGIAGGLLTILTKGIRRIYRREFKETLIEWRGNSKEIPNNEVDSPINS